MIVKQLDLNSPGEVARWDDAASNQGALYYVSSWTKVLQNTYGFRPVYLYIEDKGEIISLLPLFHVQKPFVKGELVSIPHVEAGGVAGQKLYQLYLEYLFRDLPVEKIRIYQYRDPLDDLPANTREVVMVKYLPVSSAGLLSSIKSANTRRQIRNVLEKGYTVDIDNDPKLLTEFYLLYLEKMREFGTPPHALRFMKSVSEVFGSTCRVIIIRDSQGPLAGGMLLFDEGRIMNFLYIAVPRRYLRWQIGNLIHYSVMAFGIEKRISTYIMGRCESGSSNYMYKIRLGGAVHPLYLYKFLHTPAGYRAIKEKTAKEKYRTFSRFWSCLPPFIINPLGPLVRKWIY